MPRDRPHPLAFFSLVALNKRAYAVLNHPDNIHHVSVFRDPMKDKKILYGLDIGLHIGSKSRYTLATIGRCGDILVEGSSVSRIQCSFEMHEKTKQIMLQDRSSNRSTQFFGDTAVPFELWRPHRRVVVHEKVNLIFGFGGVACDLYQFQIVWHKRDDLKANMNLDYRELNPRQARTVLEQPPTDVPSQRATRIHTPGNAETLRFSEIEPLGKGSYGTVFKAANVDSGEYLAVKVVNRPSLLSQDWKMLKREVENLSRISHANIIEYLSAQWIDNQLYIIMELKAGNVEDLIRGNLYIREPPLSDDLLRDMLQALDYLACKGIIHRDVKPENILYTLLPTGGYKYQLADFGLSNMIADARTGVGSPIFMAPELATNPENQTSKLDIWSLFVTLVYALNVDGFRDKPLQTNSLRVKAAQEAANVGIFHKIRDMAAVDPGRRAAAGDILDRLFKGEGRTSPRNQIEPRSHPSDQPYTTKSKKRPISTIQPVVKRPFRESKLSAKGRRENDAGAVKRPPMRLYFPAAPRAPLVNDPRPIRAYKSTTSDPEALRLPGAFPSEQNRPRWTPEGEC